MTAWAKYEQARFQLAQHDLEEASALTTSFCDTADRLVARDSTVIDWRLQLRGACLEMRVRIALARGSLAEARDYDDRMINLAHDELARAPSNDARITLADAQMLRGIISRQSGSADEANAAFKSAVAAWPADEPDRPSLLARKAVIFTGLGRRDSFTALASKLDRLGYRDPIYLHDRALAAP